MEVNEFEEVLNALYKYDYNRSEMGNPSDLLRGLKSKPFLETYDQGFELGLLIGKFEVGVFHYLNNSEGLNSSEIDELKLLELKLRGCKLEEFLIVVQKIGVIIGVISENKLTH